MVDDIVMQDAVMGGEETVKDAAIEGEEVEHCGDRAIMNKAVFQKVELGGKEVITTNEDWFNF